MRSLVNSDDLHALDPEQVCLKKLLFGLLNRCKEFKLLSAASVFYSIPFTAGRTSVIVELQW